MSIEEFVTTYLEKQAYLREKLDVVCKRIVDHKRQFDTMVENREQYRHEQQDKAMLTVDVIEARDLIPMDLNGFSDPFVVLTIGDDTIQTSYKKNDLNPVWNESFIFEISLNDHLLDIQVMDKDTFGNDFEGKAQVDLKTDEEIAQQKKTIVWRDLVGENGESGRGQIKLQIHWIYSRFRYFDSLSQNWGEALIADKEELEMTERDLASMEQPFGFLDTLKNLAI